MPQVDEIHVICRNHLNVSELKDGSFKSGWWIISERHVRSGVRIALHQEKNQSSYLHGIVESLSGKRSDPDDDQSRIQILVSRSTEPLTWKGGGSGTVGYLWSGGEFNDLPVIDTVLPDNLGGGNASMKSLYEAERFNWPRAQELNGGVKTNSSRMEIFKNILCRLAAAVIDRHIPVAFVDQAGHPWRLDVGSLKAAIANGWLEPVELPPREFVHQVRIMAPFAARQAELIGILRDINRRRRGVDIEEPREEEEASQEIAPDELSAQNLRLITMSHYCLRRI